MLFKSCGQRKAGSVYIVEMIVVKAVGDNGMKESQGFLSFGASVCSCLYIGTRGQNRWQQELASTVVYSPEWSIRLVHTG